MLNLKPETLTELVAILKPFMRDTNDRSPIVTTALGNSCPVLTKINWVGNVDTFIPHLLLTLEEYGEVNPNKQALWALLEHIRSKVGVDVQRQIDKLRSQIDIHSQSVVTHRTIFLSDTNSLDVDEYRRTTQELIQEQFAEKWDVIARQDLSFEDLPSLEQCHEAADLCGIFISILGAYDGSFSEAENLSYVESEFQAAENNNKKKIICFMLTGELPAGITTHFLLEQTSLFLRQKKFREYIESEKAYLTVENVANLDDFRENLQAYLHECQHPKSRENDDHKIEKELDFLVKKSHLNYDRLPVLSHDFQELDGQLINHFLNQKLAQRVLRIKKILRFTQEEHLQILGMLDNKNRPTLGAFLCFAPQLLLTDKFAAVGLHMVVYQGERRGSSNASPDFIQDNLLNLFETGMRFLTVDSGLRRRGQIGTSERDELEIPEIALREALANALVHRDYEHPNSKDQPTRIEVYSNRVEITSFGGLPETISEIQLNQNPEEVIPFRRNHIIAEIFRIMQHAELNASGVSRMHEEAKKANIPPPEIVHKKNLPAVKVIFRRPINQTPPQNIPLSGVGEFVGRAEELEQLHANLQRSERVAISAIAGMGGVGKTELAIQYAQHHWEQGDYPGGVCWLRAREADLGTQIIQYAQGNLNISIPEGLDISTQVDYCWRNWPSGQTLVVLDDVNRYEQVKLARIPTERRFKVLITTRQRLGSPVVRLDLDVLSLEAALDLLKSLVGEKRIEAETETAQQLCQWLGYLPLVLELLGRYLAEEEDLSLEEIYEQLKLYSIEDKFLVEAPIDATAERGVAAAIDLTWQQFSSKPYIQELAFVLSLFAPSSIPWSLVESLYGQEKQECSQFIKQGRFALVKFNLVKRVDKEAYQMHPLIREFVLSKEEQFRGQVWKEKFCQLSVTFAKAIPQTPTQDILTQASEVIPHLAETATTWRNWLTDEDVVWPFVGLIRFYEGQAAYQQAEFWLKQCSLATRERWGDEHPDVAGSLNNLAELYRAMGRYEQAEPLYTKALEMRRQLLGNEHPDVAGSLNNLAELYRAMGRYEQAEPLYTKALEMRRQLLGDEHLDIAASINNLALLYNSMERYQEAEPLYTKALEMRRRLLGEEHPSVATSLNNLAGLYNLMEQYQKATPLYKKSIELYKKLLGEEHPSVATSLNNLALLYHSMRQYEEAETLYLKALKVRTNLLGENHPDLASSLNNLALLYFSQKHYTKAGSFFQKALRIAEQTLGSDHSNTIAIRGNLDRNIEFMKNGSNKD